MTDPDAPSRKNGTLREFQHWLVVNIPGDNIVKGDTLTEYVPSAPPVNTGFHRYIFLVFKQNSKLLFNESYKSNMNGDRGNFSTRVFKNKYRLNDPFTGNFFLARYDESVPATLAQLGINV